MQLYTGSVGRTGGHMQALWLENKELTLRDAPEPRADDEALIRVRLSGICGTDLELARGYYPFTGVVGHEFVGDVVEAPDSAWVGARVVGEINNACGECEMCLAGRHTHCERRSVLGIVNHNGVHAEYTSLPLANLHRVPDSVSDEAAVFAEPLAAALEILEQTRIAPSHRVLLVGAGRLGQLVAQVLALTGAHLRVVARHDLQRRLLASRGIVTVKAEDVAMRHWDVVVEATGSPSGFELARSAVRPRGTLMLKSTYRGTLTLDMAPFVVDEITVIGSRCGPFAPALRLLERGDVDPVPLIAERLPLTRAVEAMELAGRPGTMKVLLEP